MFSNVVSWLKNHDGVCRLPYVETHLVDHCNLNCKACGHWSPLSDPRFADIDTHKRDITRLNQLFDRIDEIHLLGGEPMLHPQLLDFLSITRRAISESRIVLVTNGILLPSAPEDFWVTCFQNRIELWISRYPLKMDMEFISDIAKSRGVKLVVSPTKTSFWKFTKNIHGDSDPHKTFKYCRKFWKCNFLQAGRIYPCGAPALSHIFAKHFHLELPICDKDSINIHSEDITGKEILRFLENPIPWCRFCTTEWPTLDWGQSNRTIDEWA